MVVDGYTLMFAGLRLSAGSLSDRLGAPLPIAAGQITATAHAGLIYAVGGVVRDRRRHRS